MGRIHRTATADGTEIAARVHGQGPQLLAVHSGAGDGEFAWSFLLPHLADAFTCFCMSTRGRGLSADHPDHSIGALVGDVVAVAESIGEPVAVLGHSSSLVLAAAAATHAIRAVVVHEPAVPALVGGDDRRPQEAIARVVGAAGEGRYADAARIFFEDSGLLLEDEVAMLVSTGRYERMAPNVPTWAKEMPERRGRRAVGARPGSRSPCCCSRALAHTRGSVTRSPTSPSDSPTRRSVRSQGPATWGHCSLRWPSPPRFDASSSPRQRPWRTSVGAAAVIDTLRQHPRDDKLLRAVERTYVDPAPTQEAAAARLGLPFSTYRRHLTQGIERVVAWLWDREVYGSSGPG
jgi:hypothetical protein